MDSPSELPSAPALAEYLIGLGLGMPDRRLNRRCPNGQVGSAGLAMAPGPVYHHWVIQA